MTDKQQDDLSPDERKLRIDEHKLEIEREKLRLDNHKFAHDRSFKKTWLPIILPVCTTVVIAIVSSTITLIDKKAQEETTRRAGIQAEIKDRHDWSVKVVELYLKNPASFDLSNDREKAGRNLQLLASVAPAEVQSLLEIEVAKLTPTTNSDGTASSDWLSTLGAISRVQKAIGKSNQLKKAAYGHENNASESLSQAAAAKPSSCTKFDEMTVYIQYPEGSCELEHEAKEFITSKGATVHCRAAKETGKTLLVKYYLRREKEFAEELLLSLKEKLKLSDGEARLIKSQGHTMPEGFVEVWLPSASQKDGSS